VFKITPWFYQGNGREERSYNYLDEFYASPLGEKQS
jgi:hypothetical protein